MKTKAIRVVTTLIILLIIAITVDERLNQLREPELKRSVSSVARTEEVKNFVHFEDLRLKNFTTQRSFFISNSRSYSRLNIINDTDRSDLKLQLKCDQSFQVASNILSTKISKRRWDLPQLKILDFHLSYGESQPILLNNSIKNCVLSFANPNKDSEKGQVKIQSESINNQWLVTLESKIDRCEVDQFQKEKGVDNYFQLATFPQLSCSYETEANQIETLETPESGFLAKVEMLLGKKLDKAFIQNQDPSAELDFSSAPKLKAIFVATLVFRSDFYGNVIARLLKYHADRGTMVFIITTQYMMFDKDKELLRTLAEENGNIRLQEFVYYDPKFILTQPLRYIDNKFRDMHIKLFITLADQEQNNAVITGGRNIHDGFLFREPPDYSQKPNLIQYGSEDSFVHWNDFEYKISSKNIAEMSAAQLLRFWNRDTITEETEPFFNEVENLQKESGNKVDPNPKYS